MGNPGEAPDPTTSPLNPPFVPLPLGAGAPPPGPPHQAVGWVVPRWVAPGAIVVLIETQTYSRRMGQGQGLGTGMVISADGLVLTNDHVVGMNTAVSSDGQNIGFAIGVNQIKSLLAQLEKGGAGA